nr:syntaxin-112-like [Malus domestica]
MNDLMTKSFLSYVELKKQAQKDLEADLDVETGAGKLNPSGQENLSQFFQEVGAIKADMEEITNLLHDLHCLNEEAKSTHSANILHGLRDRMESDTVAVLRKAKIIKARLEVLDQSNAINRKMSNVYKEGSTADRTRMSITGGLRVKLRDLVDNFQYLIRIEGKTELDMGNKVRHEAVIDIQGSLTKLHQVFLDMAVLVEAQGEDIENIEENVANAGYCISGGTNSLHYASQMKKKKKWVYWVWAVGLIMLTCGQVSKWTTKQTTFG